MIKINCINGYFQLRETSPGEINKFIQNYGFDLVLLKDYFTFSFLNNAPEFSIQGGEYLGVVCSKTYSGEPWDIMKENNIIYDFIDNKAKLLNQVIKSVTIVRSSLYYVINGLVMPGSLTDEGSLIRTYEAWYDFKTNRFKYGRIDFE